MMREPVVRAANTVIPCCECVAVRGYQPCAGADGCAEGRQGYGNGRGQACANGKACGNRGQARRSCEARGQARSGGSRRGRWSSSKTNPPNRPRDPAYAFVSTRPAEKVTNEVSIMIGYTLKPGSESSLEVGGASYAMYTQGDGLWIKNAAEEERMVDAMRKSADVIVKGVSARGTETTDTFSLKGLSQALDKLAQDCKR